MRKSSRDLFDLVKSLTPSEKRYFSLYSSRQHPGRSNKYLQLFGILETMEDYDDAYLTQQGKSLGIRDIPGAKTYLYASILDALHRYTLGHAVEDKVRVALNQISTLFHRGMYEQCFRLLAKARKLAEESDDFLSLLQILTWEIQIRNHTGSPARRVEQTEEFYNVQLRTLTRLRNMYQFDRLNSRMAALEVSNGLVRDHEMLKMLDSLMDSELLRDEALALSPTARLNFLDTKMRYHRVRGELWHTHRYARRKIRLFEENPEFAAHNAYRFIWAYTHFVMECNKVYRFEECEAALAKLWSLKNRFRRLALTVEEGAFFAEIWLRMNTTDAEGMRRVLVQTASWVDGAVGKIETVSELGIYYSMAFAYILLEDFHKALLWTNRLINHPRLSLMGDVASFARIMNLIVHYELGNTELLEHHLRSTYRFMRSRKRLYKVEALLLKFIRKLPSLRDEQHLVREFAAARRALESVRHDPFERNALEYFEFLGWLDCKIENLCFLETYRRRMEQYRQERSGSLQARA